MWRLTFHVEVDVSCECLLFHVEIDISCGGRPFHVEGDDSVISSRFAIRSPRGGGDGCASLISAASRWFCSCASCDFVFCTADDPY